MDRQEDFSVLSLLNGSVDLKSSSIQNKEKNQNKQMKKILLKILESEQEFELSDIITNLRLTLGQIKEIVQHHSGKSEKNQKIYHKYILYIHSRLIKLFYQCCKYQDALQHVNLIMKIIETPHQLENALTIIYGIPSLISLKEYDVNSNLQFKSQSITKSQFLYIIGRVKMLQRKTQQAIELYKKCYQQCKSDKNVEFTFSILQILQELKQHEYDKVYNQLKIQVGALNNSNIFQEVSTYNIIMRKFINKENQLQQKKKAFNKKNIHIIIEYLKNYEYYNKQKKPQNIQQLIKLLQKEKDSYIIEQLLETDLYKKIISLVTDKIQSLGLIYFGRTFFSQIKTEQVKEQSSKYIKSQIKSQSIRSKQKSQIKTQSIKQKPKSNIFMEPIKEEVQNIHKKINIKDAINFVVPTHFYLPTNQSSAKQMMQCCKKGSYVTKVNFGNDSRAQKYLRITEKDFRWSEDEKQINDDYSNCKWKHVKGVIYGKVTRNFCKKVNKDIQPWRCFSIITDDRTYDFIGLPHRKDIALWMQGISYHLQVIRDKNKKQNSPFYSKGRLLWKLMFMKMKSSYLDKNKHYKNQTKEAIFAYDKAMKKKQSQEEK